MEQQVGWGLGDGVDNSVDNSVDNRSVGVVRRCGQQCGQQVGWGLGDGVDSYVGIPWMTWSPFNRLGVD